MNHDEYRQGRVPHGNGALSRLWGPNVAGRGGRCQSPIGGDEGAPELIGERDVQAVQHADTLAKGVGAPQVSNGREGRVVAAARSPRRARRGRMPGSISPARTSRDSAESISAGWCAGELTSSPAICLRTHPAAGCRAPRQRARRRPARSPAELLSHGAQERSRVDGTVVAPRAGLDPYYPYLPVRVPLTSMPIHASLLSWR